MAKERGIFKLIWKNFIASFIPRARRNLIGEDYYGTKYYEEQPRSSNPNRSLRYFEPINKENFEQELPAEWEAWLRHRRREPPTQEEIESNYKLAITKKQNAIKLLNEYSSKTNGDLPARFTSPQGTTPGNYPIYTDYKNFGRDYKTKDLNKKN